jgi:glutaminyl-peptide cyclotransferase
MRRRRSVVVAIAVASTLLAGCTGEVAGPAAAATGLRVDRFDVERAWRIVERQLRYGQRPAGSPQLRRLARRLRPLLPNSRFEPVANEHGLRNVVGTLPGRRPGILIGAHYDTLVEPSGFVAANNGAAGTALVIEVARA